MYIYIINVPVSNTYAWCNTWSQWTIRSPPATLWQMCPFTCSRGLDKNRRKQLSWRFASNPQFKTGRSSTRLYKLWYNDLLVIVKTCNACRLELMSKPSCSEVTVTNSDTAGDTSCLTSGGLKEKSEIPKLTKKKDDPTFGAIGLTKIINKDPTKDLLS